MWINSRVVTFFDRLVISVEQNAKATEATLSTLRDTITELKVQNDALKTELQSTKVTNDWLRMKVNDLEAMNKGLIERAYNVKLPVPEIMRVPTDPVRHENFSFDDIGDEAAAKLGLPAYGFGNATR